MLSVCGMRVRVRWESEAISCERGKYFRDSMDFDKEKGCSEQK